MQPASAPSPVSGVARPAVTPTTAVRAAIALTVVATLVAGCSRISSGAASDAARTATMSINAVGNIVGPDSPTTAVAGGGSGFFISSDGLGITTNHAVAGSKRLEVTLGDDPRKLAATVVAVSECDDLALIDVDVDGPVPFLGWNLDGPGPGSGTAVVALGVAVASGSTGATRQAGATGPMVVHPGTVGATSADKGLAPALTAADATFTHDAASLPGMAGGPVVDVDGRVVGVNLGTPLPQPGDAPGDDDISVAIAATTAQRVVARLLDQPGPSLGMGTIAVAETRDTPGGLWVSGVEPDSPAAQAGIRPGDVITTVGGTDLDAPDMATGGYMAAYCATVNAADGGPVAVEVTRPTTGEILAGAINTNTPLRVVASTDTRGQQRGNRSTARPRDNERADGGLQGFGPQGFHLPADDEGDDTAGRTGIPGLEPPADDTARGGHDTATGSHDTAPGSHDTSPADGSIGGNDEGGDAGGSDQPPHTGRYTAYLQVIDASGALTIEAPAVWRDINRGPGPTGLPYIAASVDLEAFAGGYTTPGVAYFAIGTESSVTETLDVLSLQLANDCADAGREPYADPTFTGAVQIWRDCDGEDMAVAVVVASAPEMPDMLFATIVYMVSDADLDAVERIFDSFDLTGD